MAGKEVCEVGGGLGHMERGRDPLWVWMCRSQTFSQPLQFHKDNY